MHPADVQHMQDPVNRADYIAAGDLRDELRQQLVRTFPTTDAVQRAHNIIVNAAHQERPDTPPALTWTTSSHKRSASNWRTPCKWTSASARTAKP